MPSPKSAKNSARRVSAQEVLDLITDLHHQEKDATREVLAELIGARLSVIDEHLKVMANDGRILRLKRGLYAPVVEMPPARAISRTVLPNGWVKIEIGDMVLDLTPREDRMLGSMMRGAADLHSHVEVLKMAMNEGAELASRIRQLEALVRDSEKSHQAKA